jgi:hypothetical protein
MPNSDLLLSRSTAVLLALPLSYGTNVYCGATSDPLEFGMLCAVFVAFS